MDSHLFRVMEEQNCSPCLADTFRRNDRPPTHFFVKKKFIHTSGAANATQRTSSLFCAGSLVRHRESPARRRELFSLRKKRTAGIRLSVWQTFGSLYRLDPTPFSPLKNDGFQGDLIPLAGVWGQRPQGLALRPRRAPRGLLLSNLSINRLKRQEEFRLKTVVMARKK